jgi:hypothetical protein
MSNQLLAESLGRDPRFEIVAPAGPLDILSIVATLQPHVALISADFDGAAKKGLQVARTLNGRDHLGCTKFSVVGHDWGARAAYTLAVSMKYASLHRESVFV